MIVQDFDSQNVNDENIRQYLQMNLHQYVRELSLQRNQLTELSWITEATQLDTLKELDVGDNRIEWFSWDDIPPLTKSINLYLNKPGRLPRLGKYNTCVRVKALNLCFNEIENIECDHIPHTVVELYLTGNKLTSLSDLSHTHLTSLSLSYNQLQNIECHHITHTLVQL